jgi:molybdopterin synthase sulfur carrier subunit
LPLHSLAETAVKDSFDAPLGFVPSPAAAARVVTLLLFARLREAVGTGQETLTLPDEVRDVAGLLAWLRARGGAWEAELAPAKPVRVAVNHEMANAATPVRPGDEVAVFPPVTGG